MKPPHSPSSLSDDARAALLAEIPAAKWEYDEQADEMEVSLPGTAGGAGYYALVRDDLYVRLDAETGEPLGMMIPAYQLWLGRHIDSPAPRDAKAIGAPGADGPARWIAEQARAAPEVLARELAGAGR